MVPSARDHEMMLSSRDHVQRRNSRAVLHPEASRKTGETTDEVGEISHKGDHARHRENRRQHVENGGEIRTRSSDETNRNDAEEMKPGARERSVAARASGKPPMPRCTVSPITLKVRDVSLSIRVKEPRRGNISLRQVLRNGFIPCRASGVPQSCGQTPTRKALPRLAVWFT